MPDRLTLCREACADEIERFNAALSRKPLLIESPGSMHHGHYAVVMRSDFWLVTESGGTTCSWAYCNDGRWAALLEAAGVSRHQLFCR